MKETNIVSGIVLKCEPYKEADIKVFILTADGIQTAYAIGAAKQNARLKAATQLFTIAEFSITGSRITGAHVLLMGTPITREINRYYLACSICEVLLHLRNYSMQIANQLFYLTARTFEALIDTQISAYKIFINFFTKLLILHGYDVMEFENSPIIEKFKATSNEEIDEIKLSLTDAKQCIKHIKNAYQELLDLKIPNADIF